MARVDFTRVRRPRVLLACVLLLTATIAIAQAQQWRGRMYIRDGFPEQRGGFMFCRLLYSSVRREQGGSGWSTDYPNADNNFMTRITQLTYAPVSKWVDGENGFLAVPPNDPRMFQCPFLFASDVGTASFDDQEAASLRRYLLKGGFLWVDDFWGEYAWLRWTDEIERVLPEYPVVPLNLDHPLFNVFYQVKEIPQIPSIRFWRNSRGGTSERGAESAIPEMHAIFDERGRLLVLMSHDTDIADGWERETDNEDFFYAFTARAYGVGINVALWAMSH